MKLLGLDPGLRRTGWGVIVAEDNRLGHPGQRLRHQDGGLGLAERLVQIHDGLARVIERYRPDEAAVEETFVNRNPTSTLKTGPGAGRRGAGCRPRRPGGDGVFAQSGQEDGGRDRARRQTADPGHGEYPPAGAPSPAPTRPTRWPSPSAMPITGPPGPVLRPWRRRRDRQAYRPRRFPWARTGR